MSGALGGQLYGLGERAGQTGWFWLLAAAQCLLLPLFCSCCAVVRRGALSPTATWKEH